MVENDSSLILFGGWTHPSSYPLHQTSKLFHELHIFDLLENKYDVVKIQLKRLKTNCFRFSRSEIHKRYVQAFEGLSSNKSLKVVFLQVEPGQCCPWRRLAAKDCRTLGINTKVLYWIKRSISYIAKIHSFLLKISGQRMHILILLIRL